jgi:tryptophan halogenase
MRPPRKVLVVGGGSAGWMTAAYLNAALNVNGQKVAEISLIESPDVPRVGVGEATIPNINHILSVIGIDQHDFMRRVDGTFKQSIKYVNWVNNDGSYYYHPFCRFRKVPIDRSAQDWLMSNRSIPFVETVSEQAIICELGLSPQMLGAWDFGTPLKYAYHMNALKFADFLCELSTTRGVSHYVDHVVDVEMAENGDIAAVKTRSGRRLDADIFIDCTGFAALLIEKKLGVKWIDCSQWLLCDRAQDKRSLGYVHSSAFLDDESAEREIRAFEGPHAQNLSSRIVPFKVGHREKAWSRNCISIGLASSFIEPLESTGLYLSDLAAVMLAEHFPYRGEMAPLAYRFNRIMANRFYEILDFINLHYCLTRREDNEFWREIRNPERINDRLRAKLEYWRIKPISPTDFEDQFFPGMPDTPLSSGGIPGDHRCPIDTATIFGIDSYEAILYGMDFARKECDHRYGLNRPPPRVYKEVIDKLQQCQQKLPPHDFWLKRILGMPNYQTSSKEIGG